MTDDFNKLSVGMLRTDDVLSVVERYPYFHAAQLLNLINKSDNNPELFLANSSSIAILLPEREVLTDMYSRLLTNRVSVAVDQNDEIVPDEEGVDNMIDTIRHRLSGINRKFVESKPSNKAYTIEPDKDRDTNLSVEQTRKSVLIDEFIKKSPSISRTPSSITGATDAYIKPSIDAENIVSETLAIIYTKQGNIGKAISTYVKLIELNPDKADYFNLKIEELKNERGTKN